MPTRKFGNSILALAYPLIIIGSSSSHEQLQITINSYFGSVLCQVESLGKEYFNLLKRSGKVCLPLNFLI